MASSSSNTDDSFMSSFTRHQRLMNGYIKQKKALKLSSTDGDVLKEKHRFIRNDKEDEKEAGINWEIRMAMKYYRRLHKEYALVDLSRYKDGKIGLRWRTEDEVVNGKGQFECSNITRNKKCSRKDSLHSFEVNFKYFEDKVVKNELVKVRLCPHCAKKLPNAKKVIKEMKEKTSQTFKSKSKDVEEEEDKLSKDKKMSKKKRKVSLVDGEDEGREKVNKEASAVSAAEVANIWSHDAPKAKTEEDDMDTYLNSLFF